MTELYREISLRLTVDKVRINTSPTSLSVCVTEGSVTLLFIQWLYLCCGYKGISVFSQVI